VYAHTPNLLQQSRLPVFDNPEGFENWLVFSSDVTFTIRCKRWATALHFNLFVRSTIQIPANSKTQNLGLTQRFQPSTVFPIHGFSSSAGTFSRSGDSLSAVVTLFPSTARRSIALVISRTHTMGQLASSRSKSRSFPPGKILVRPEDLDPLSKSVAEMHDRDQKEEESV